MQARHVVVDGSNIATEGNSLPSLNQLDQAVREFLIENPDDVVTVVVDATFGHRIPADERPLFEQAELEGDIVCPPAGAIGRGDAFLLRVADKVGAVVLSNDSFQEFHGEYEWLFDKGRLIGGKPVPGVGWIFTPRTPVRGPRSRESVKEAKRKKRDVPGEPVESGLDMAAERSRGRGGERKVQRAIAVAVEEAVEPEKGARKRRRRRRVSELPAEPLNEPLHFITFIAGYQLGDEVEGTVEEFSSHGAFISVGGARCYLPLSAMGEEAPRSAREVLRKGEKRTFVVQAFDAMRRGIELALPGFAHPAGAPLPETVDAEIRHGEVAGPDKQAAPIKQVGPIKQAGRAKKAPPVTEPGLVKKRLPAKKAAAVKEAAPAKEPALARRPTSVKKAEAASSPAPNKRPAPAKQAAPAKRTAPAKQQVAAKQAAAAKSPGTAKRAAQGGRTRPLKVVAQEKAAENRVQPTKKAVSPARPVKQAAPAVQTKARPTAAAKSAPPARSATPVKQARSTRPVKAIPAVKQAKSAAPLKQAKAPGPAKSAAVKSVTGKVPASKQAAARKAPVAKR